MINILLSLIGGLVLTLGGDSSAQAPNQDIQPNAGIRQTSQLVVCLRPGVEATAFARQTGMHIVRRFRSNPSIYVMDAGSVTAAEMKSFTLRQHPAVLSVFQDRILPVVPNAFTPDDPYFFAGTPAGSLGQWYLKNGIGGTIDARVTRAWNRDRTGLGVVIGVVDDGIETGHPDLAPNYNAANSFDFFTNDADPSPDAGQNHGTAVAGIAAARGHNALGITGVAPFANLAGLKVNLTSSPESDYADATLFNSSSIGVKEHGYGLDDPYVPQALESAAIDDSAAAGCINVYSAGNSRRSIGQDTGTKATLNRPGSINVSALRANGKVAPYSGFGANVFCTAPSSVDLVGTSPSILTTDRTGAAGYNGFTDQDYTTTFGGTSASSAIVTGVMAMLKQVVPTADARLAKHLLARTCEVVHADDASKESDGGWKTNSAGFHFNQNYGFGLVNAFALTEMAKGYAGCTPLKTTDTGVVTVGAVVPDGTGTAKTKSLTIGSVTPLEEVSVHLNITHSHRGDLEAFLISPTGTQSRLFIRSPSDDGDDIDWWFTTNAFWGENPKGTWRVRVFDRVAGNAGTWNDCELVTRGGTPLPPYDARFVSQTVPTQVAAGATFTGSIKFQNIGFFAWDGTVGLYDQNDAIWGRKRISTFGTVSYGTNKTYNATFTAPTTPGTYDFSWRLRKGGVGYFGPTTPVVQITVTGAAKTLDVSMLSMTFSPQTLHVNAGDTVRWTNNSLFGHTVEPDVATPGMDSDATFPSGVPANQQFSWTVPAATASGTKFFYHCRFHGTAGNGTGFGTGMTGVVIVD